MKSSDLAWAFELHGRLETVKRLIRVLEDIKQNHDKEQSIPTTVLTHVDVQDATRGLQVLLISRAAELEIELSRLGIEQ